MCRLCVSQAHEVESRQCLYVYSQALILTGRSKPYNPSFTLSFLFRFEALPACIGGPCLIEMP